MDSNGPPDDGRPTETSASRPVDSGGQTGKRGRALRKRLLLSLTTFVLMAALLEGMTHLLVSPPAPRLLRDQIYVSELPLVSGRDTVARLYGEGHTPLAEGKRPGEVRVFVFGESSVQGSPWEYAGSPPTMLYDQLHARFPGRDLTVVNMGRGAAMTRDVYYFLASIRRFKPDYIVFYMGSNDEYGSDAEMCMPVAWPRSHAAWRWLVERSRLLWTVRALGPYHLIRMRGGSRNSRGAGGPSRCNAIEAFRAWTEILVSTAEEMGAKVVVTTFVENGLSWLENPADWASARSVNVADKTPPYRQLLSCLLADHCDVPAAWARQKRVIANDSLGNLYSCLAREGCNPIEPLLRIMELHSPYHSSESQLRREAWLQTAVHRGADAIDFFGYIETRVPGGPLPPFFLEERHLSITGYWQLAWLWTTRLSPRLGGDGRPPPKGPMDFTDPPPPIDESRYLAPSLVGLRTDAACVTFAAAALYLRANQLLVAASLLQRSIEYDEAADHSVSTAPSRAGLMARLMRGWLRRENGADPGLPPSLAPLLDDLRVQEIVDYARRDRQCANLGGDRLLPFLSPPAASAPAPTPMNPPNPVSNMPTGSRNDTRGGLTRDEWIDVALGVVLLSILGLIIRQRRRR